MSDESRLLETVFSNKVGNVGCHGCVVVARVVRGFAVVAKVLLSILNTMVDTTLLEFTYQSIDMAA